MPGSAAFNNQST